MDGTERKRDEWQDRLPAEATGHAEHSRSGPRRLRQGPTRTRCSGHAHAAAVRQALEACPLAAPWEEVCPPRIVPHLAARAVRAAPVPRQLAASTVAAAGSHRWEKQPVHAHTGRTMKLCRCRFNLVWLVPGPRIPAARQGQSPPCKLAWQLMGCLPRAAWRHLVVASSSRRTRQTEQCIIAGGRAGLLGT